MSKRCMVCRREFPEDSTQCYQCNLPLWNTADPAVVQEMDLNRILLLILRRHDNLIQELPHKSPVRLNKPNLGVVGRLLRGVMTL